VAKKLLVFDMKCDLLFLDLILTRQVYHWVFKTVKGKWLMFYGVPSYGSSYGDESLFTAEPAEIAEKALKTLRSLARSAVNGLLVYLSSCRTG